MSIAAIFQLATPFTEAELSDVSYEQNLDGLLLTHMNHPPQLLRRFDHNDWRIGNAPIGIAAAAPATATATATVHYNDTVNGGYTEQEYQYGVSAVAEAGGRESEPRDTAVVTNDLGTRPGSPDGNFNSISWSAVTGAAEYRVYRKKNGSYGYIGTVSATEPLTFIDDNILADYSDSPPVLNDPFPEGNYPATVTFHSRRAWYGRSLKKPSGIWASQIDDVFNHDKSRPLRATDSIATTLIARRLNTVRHLLSLGDLLALTSDGIFSVKPTGDGGITATGFQTNVEGFQGVGRARPETIGRIGFYTSARGNRVEALGYSFEQDGYKGSDVTVFAPHLFKECEVVQFAWCEEPSRVLWTLRDDGKLAALTWQQEQDVWGWTLCETDGFVESICSISEEGRDVLYASIRRQVGGEDFRSIERLTSPLWINEGWTGIADAVVMDAAYTYRGTPATTLRGLHWLEGVEVAVLADGFVVPGRSVVGGQLTPPLDVPASTISVGRRYTSYIRTLPIVGSAGNGSTKGRRQMLRAAVLELMNSVGLRVGVGKDPDPATLYDAPLPPGTGADRPLQPYSGELEVEALEPGDWRSAKLTIAQTDPLPMVILGVFPDIEIGG